MTPKGKLKCVKCKKWFIVNDGFVVCPFCGSKYIWKIRSNKFVFAGGVSCGNTKSNNE